MRYAKSLVAAVMAVLTTVQVALDHGPVTTTQWVTLGIGAVVTLAGVWAVPNSTSDQDLTALAGKIGVLRDQKPPTPPAA